MDYYSTIMILIRLYIGVPILVIGFLSLTEGTDIQPKSKRQIYREQVLPSRGGKIPESAFTAERLALNRLNKEGISIPDGVLLEHRNVHNHPHINQHDPEHEDSLIKIIQNPEDRYVAPSGKYYHSNPLTVKSTYLIRKPIGSENTRVRPPVHQVPLNPFNQPNQVYSSFPNNFYQQQYIKEIPPELPVGLTTPPQNIIHTRIVPQKYGSVEIDPKPFFPVESPSHNYLPANFRPVAPPPPPSLPSPPLKKYFPQGFPPTIVHHPHPYGHDAPVSYQSVSYFPNTTPLVLLKKGTLTEEYHGTKSLTGNAAGNHGSHHTEDLYGILNWPALLEQYSQISSKINALHHDTYGQSTPHSQFLTPEVLRSIDSDSEYYSANVGRYARKSKEVSFAEHGTDFDGSNVRLGTVKVKCSTGLENTVEDGSTQCYA